MKFDLPQNVLFILDRFRRHGYRADVVGGPVRDFYLGTIPGDYDVTTNALPDQIKEVFSDMRTVDTGIKHGTVTLVLDGSNYEITTYRVDGEYKDARHPEQVRFTARIEEDLSRRDFTMNSMAYSPDHGITDPYGAREDIDRRLIRAVGDPTVRFGEDALRILRALRFSSKLDFCIEEATRVAIFNQKHLLSAISNERIFAELTKLLAGTAARRVLLDYREVIAVFLPELSALTIPDSVKFDAARPAVRMAYLFCRACGKDAAQSFASSMRRLRCDGNTLRTGSAVIGAMQGYRDSTDGDVLRLMSSLGADAALLAAELAYTLGIGSADTAERIKKHLSLATPYRLSDLAVKGTDLLSLGFGGKQIGDLLHRLLLSVMDGAPNDKEHLLAYARSLRDNAGGD